MEFPHVRNIGQSFALATASLGLGAYLASGSSHIAAQVLMLSFPPASLWVATRRVQRTQEANEHRADDSAVFEELTAGLEFDILTKAS